MKTLILALILSTSAIYAQSQLPEYYLANPSKYLGQKITVYVNSVNPSNFSSEPGFVSFRAHTSFRDSHGKSIYVRVPEAQAPQFLKRYGTNERYTSGHATSLPLSGIFSQRNEEYFIDYGGTGIATSGIQTSPPISPAKTP